MKKIGHGKVNIYLASFIAIAIFVLCLLLIFRGSNIVRPSWVRGLYPFIVFLYVISLLLIHEFIHIIAASFFMPIRDISLRFKILVWEVRMAKPLKRNHYLLTSLAPGFVLSLVGVILLFTFSSVSVKYFSAYLFIIGFCSATGDAMLVLKALKFPKECYILDKGAEFDVLKEE